MDKLFRLLNDNKSGATAIEYGLLASLIAVGMLVGLGTFSDALLLVLNNVTTAVNDAGS